MQQQIASAYDLFHAGSDNDLAGYSLYPNGVAFTLGLNPSFVTGGEGLESLVNLLRSYVKLGGMQIQFNTVINDAFKRKADQIWNRRNLRRATLVHSMMIVKLQAETK